MDNIDDIDFFDSTAKELWMLGDVFHVKVVVAVIGDLWATVSVDFLGVTGLTVDDQPATTTQMTGDSGDVLAFKVTDKKNGSAEFVIDWKKFGSAHSDTNIYKFFFRDLEYKILSTYTEDEYLKDPDDENIICNLG